MYKEDNKNQKIKGFGNLTIAYLLIHKEDIMHFVLELGILPFKIIADLIGLYFIVFKDGADSGMGNVLQSGISRFFAVELDDCRKTV